MNLSNCYSHNNYSIISRKAWKIIIHTKRYNYCCRCKHRRWFVNMSAWRICSRRDIITSRIFLSSKELNSIKLSLYLNMNCTWLFFFVYNPLHYLFSLHLSQILCWYCEVDLFSFVLITSLYGTNTIHAEINSNS